MIQTQNYTTKNNYFSVYRKYADESFYVKNNRNRFFTNKKY